MKYTGMEELVDGMKLNDLHSYIYLAPGIDLCKDANIDEIIEVSVRLSIMTDQVPEEEVDLNLKLYGWNSLGEKIEVSSEVHKMTITPWEQRDLEPLSVTMPSEAGLFVYSMQLVDANGKLLNSNFTTFRVEGAEKSNANILSFEPNSFMSESWSEKQWNILDGLKVNGAGHGYFEYEIAIPKHMDLEAYSKGTLIAELSSKPLNGKDKDQEEDKGRDYMRGKGMHDPGQNPNSYPMTDEYQNPSTIKVSINSTLAVEIELADDPADHRGILSWHAQPRDRKLREAGTYGYLVKIPIDKAALNVANITGKIRVRFEVAESDSGGLAIYGQDFGRYPLEPTIVFE
jgi:hypothetical protein